MAFNYSERFRTPVILLIDETIGHLRESVDLSKYEKIKIINRQVPSVSPEKYLPFAAEDHEPPQMAPFGKGYRFHVTGLVHDESGFPCTDNHAAIEKLLRRLNNKIMAYQDEITLYKEYMTEDADFLIIAFGSAARSAASAVSLLRKEGIKAGLLYLQTLWPFPEKLIYEKCLHKRLVLVPEMNLGQYAGEIKKVVNDNTAVVQVSQIDGQLLKPQKIISSFKGEEKHAKVL